MLIKLTKLNQKIKNSSTYMLGSTKNLVISEFNLRTFEMFVTEITRNREQNRN